MADALREITGAAFREAGGRGAMQRLHVENRPLLQRLMVAWQQFVPQRTGAELALTLEAAAHQEQAIAGRTTVELVWAGPAAPGSGLRDTEQVLLELISTARESIYFVTFAAYEAPSLVAALQGAATRGVRIVCVLEDKEESAGKVTLNPLEALGVFDRKSAMAYVWPLEARTRNAKGQCGSLHAKCVVVDGHRLFVSSANLTEFAMHRYKELLRFLEEQPWQMGSEKSTVKPDALEALRYTAMVGAIERARFVAMTGLPARTGRRVLASLIDAGVLETASSRAPVGFAVPVQSLRFRFPRLWPEVEADV